VCKKKEKRPGEIPLNLIPKESPEKKKRGVRCLARPATAAARREGEKNHTSTTGKKNFQGENQTGQIESNTTGSTGHKKKATEDGTEGGNNVQERYAFEEETPFLGKEKPQKRRRNVWGGGTRGSTSSEGKIQDDTKIQTLKGCRRDRRKKQHKTKWEL